MAGHASGTFEVKMAPQGTENKAEGSTLGRMSIDKQIHGDLEATSKGEMLSAMTDVKGSAGYVAIERVTGTLKGRSGSFVLQHTGTMNRGEPQLTITVVPDSASGRPTISSTASPKPSKHPQGGPRLQCRPCRGRAGLQPRAGMASKSGL